ncbi:uncharacterized protein [Temnothorax longispinosus]|uniref:uncharacterized protein n=1 Tax=Temnothorax longispinosus TaxID=300112 RepID=UPI003A99864D
MCVRLSPECEVKAHAVISRARERITNYKQIYIAERNKRISIPRVVQDLLQLGDGFSLPFSDNKSKICFEFIKRVESSAYRLPAIKKVGLRNYTSAIVNRLFDSNPSLDSIGLELRSALRDTNIFIRHHPEIIFTRADKGNTTVAMLKSEYMEKMSALLGDETTYSIIDRNPTRKIISTLVSLLTRWKNKKYITQQEYRSLHVSDGILPRAYGLPKIHKPDCPLRIIVSSINTPLYDLASFLQKILHKSLPISGSSIKDSFTFFEKLNNKEFPPEFVLFSLDVISLFTNVPTDLVIDSICRQWNLIGPNTKLPREEFVAAIKFVLDSTYFTFDNVIYRQTHGSPMGSPLSSDAAEIVMRDLENKALKRLKYIPPFYFRYVDDVASAAPLEFLQDTLNIFNFIHNRLQFTIEINNNNTLNFLDTTIIAANERLIFDWYHKPTFSERYLSFFSSHPNSQKRGVAMGLIDRAFRLS